MLNLRQNTAERPRILVIDDEDIIRQLLMRSLGSKGYEVEVAEDASVAIEKIGKNFFNLLIIDLKMPKINGIDVLKDIKKANPYIEVIIITGYPAIESAVAAIKIGAFDYICKPFDVPEMETVVRKCLEKQKFSINHIELSELGALFEVSKTITATASLDSLLGLILDSVLGVVKAGRGCILLREESSGKLAVKAARGLSPEAVDNNMIKLSEEICLSRSEQRDCPLVSDSFISLPLISKSLYSQENILGTINIAEKISRESFTERDRVLLSVLSGQAVAAIENYRLYNQLRNKIEALSRTVKQLNDTQNQLIQSEKLSAVGQLAFGIAHEIRNPLGVILGGVEFLENSWSGGKEKVELKKSMERIKDSIGRANKIVTDLLKFSKASQLELQQLDACRIMDNVISLIKNRAYLSSVKIEKEYAEKEFPVMADPTMLQQALFNLCINAIDAMPKGGRLYLNIRWDAQEELEKKTVVIEVTDTGTGIPEDKLPRIFEPFFTTKEPGKGTGLGLSIVHLILERHKGTIEVSSRLNQGTSFTVKLPAAGNDQAVE
jgi:signal transduction histidine kinase/ActR/RegA family two-component response regulator